MVGFFVFLFEGKVASLISEDDYNPAQAALKHGGVS